MNTKQTVLVSLILLTSLIAAGQNNQFDSRFLSFITEASAIQFYWKDESGQGIGSIQNLKTVLETKNQHLRFAMNGGMYGKDNSPQGLYIENGNKLIALDTLSGPGNFYLKPNGVFYITRDRKPVVCETNKFRDTGNIKFATQSGPTLLVNGKTHPAFKKDSRNLNIRNGVGILPNNKVIFVMSKVEINFYDFAAYFKKMNCKDALYLDGFVSRTYLPEENWTQLDGNFGVIIGVSK